MTEKIIAPSLLAANLIKIAQEVHEVVAAGADWLHIDVMDNHFVPNLTFGPWLVKALRKEGIEEPLDVHLMAQPTTELIHNFAATGADMITIHAEAEPHLERQLTLIRKLGCLAGVAFNPSTPLSCLEYVLPKVDLILIMSVNPGFGGQSFIPSVFKKIKQAREFAASAAHEIRVSVDGGVDLDNISKLARAGADTFVSGSSIFASDSYQQTIEAMRSEIKKI